MTIWEYKVLMEKIVMPAGNQGWLCGGGGTQDSGVYYWTTKFLSPVIFKSLIKIDFAGSTSYFSWLLPIFCKGSFHWRLFLIPWCHRRTHMRK